MITKNLLSSLEWRYQIVRLLQSQSPLLDEKLEEYQNTPENYYVYYIVLRDLDKHSIASLFELPVNSIPIEVRKELQHLQTQTEFDSSHLKEKLLNIEKDELVRKASALQKRQRTCC